MSDLIKREDAINVVEEIETMYLKGQIDLTYPPTIKRLKSIPSAERKGEWIWSPRDTDGTVSGCCSNCSFSHLFIGGHTAQYNYCPNCGARMKGAEDE